VVALGALLGALLVAACGTAPAAPASAPASAPAAQRLRLATTTSTADSGLLEAILPGFERRFRARVEVIAVGTGQALTLGENGDVDVVLVHARAQEDAFVAAGFGVGRRDVMYNDFIVVGPPTDPAGIAGLPAAAEAFRLIATAQAAFISRGDDSGTHSRERSLWATAGITPTSELGWYRSVGQGMGETLVFANEQGAYTLSDRGTFLAMRDKLPDLTVMVGGASVAENTDKALLNPYGVIVVNPARHPEVNAELAEQFAVWLVEPETQQQIGAFGQERYGQPLFYPGVPE
jgi:tungstate transport system substrate-binding protein